MKNIDLKLSINSLKLSEEKRRQIAAMMLKNGPLLFAVLICAFALYSSNMIYKRAYVDINNIQYRPVVSGISSDNKTLDEIIKDIGDRQDNLKAMEDKEYTDPFSFRDVADTGEKEILERENTDTDTGETEVEIPSADSAAGRRIR